MIHQFQPYVNWQQKKRSTLNRTLLIIIMPVLFFGFIFLVVAPAVFLPERSIVSLGLTHPWELCIGLPLCILGSALYLWTIILFAKAKGTQVPLVPTQQLVTTGPYSITRNPMVTGVIGVVTGVGIMLNSLTVILVGLVVPVIYLIYIKLVEEKELEARFGEAYSAYKKRTAFIIPKLF